MKTLIAIALIATVSQADYRCDMAREEFNTTGVQIEAAVAGEFYSRAEYYIRKRIGSIVKIKGFCDLNPKATDLLNQVDVLMKKALIQAETLQGK